MPDKKKLSALIREGAELRPKCTGDFFDDVSQGEYIVMGSCALGAAFEAATGIANIYLAPVSLMDFKQAIRPFCSLVPRVHVLKQVVVRNDRERETREQIADWLEAEGY